MGRRWAPAGLAPALLLLLAACTRAPMPASVAPAPPQTLAWSAVAVDWTAIEPEVLGRARAAFLATCPALTPARRDLVVSTDEWAPACAAAARRELGDREFFEQSFTGVRLGDGRGLATGYYEPELSASPIPTPEHRVPVLGPPPGLVDLDLGRFHDDLRGRRLRARWNGETLEPLPDRAAIERGALAGLAPVIAWVADPVELFFLQVQGSGRLRMANGEVWAVGYAGQNGHPYVALGRLMAERGLLGSERGMEPIMAALRAQADGGAALMRENPSYVFFRRLHGPGPLGALGVPLSAWHHAAVDPRHLPYGAPMLAALDIEGQPSLQLMVAADTGGAIRGANRLDLFLGSGPEARRIAGNLASPVAVTVLVPPSAAGRLIAGGR